MKSYISFLIFLFFFFLINFNWRLITTLWWVLPHIDMNHPWVYGCPPAPVLNTPSLFLLFLKHSSHSLCLLAYSLSRVQLCETPWTAAHQASLSFTIAQTLLKLMSIKSVMPSTHLILCCPLLLLPSIFPSIRVFSSEPALHIRWLKLWSFSFSTSPSNEYLVLVLSLNCVSPNKRC